MIISTELNTVIIVLIICSFFTINFVVALWLYYKHKIPKLDSNIIDKLNFNIENFIEKSEILIKNFNKIENETTHRSENIKSLSDRVCNLEKDKNKIWQ